MTSTHTPHIICHMMTTIDGKIASGESVDILDEYFDVYSKTEDMLPEHSGWMCGRVTMQMFAKETSETLPETSEHTSSDHFIAQHSATKFFFGVDTKGQLRWKGNTIQLTNVKDPLHLVIIVSKSTPSAYLSYLRELGISYIVSGDTTIDFSELVSKIYTHFGVETLLLEGGGLLNGAVMEAGYVDEISLLLTPTVLNKSSAPSLFERKEISHIDTKKYVISSVKTLEKNCIWIRYSKI